MLFSTFVLGEFDHGLLLGLEKASLLKELRNGLHILNSLAYIFSSLSFVIVVNLLHP